MGTDNLFRKRSAKLSRELRRKQAKLATYDRVLIVCEGEKTERYYFQELCDHYRLNSTNVEISGDCGSAPINVIERAKALYQAEKRNGIPFDRVYCVFDKDTHSTYKSALEAVTSIKPNATFFATNSVPCFEYWLLLHFVDTTKPFYGTEGAKSAGDQVLDELKKYIADYAKGDHGHFENLFGQLPQAIQRSRRVLKSANTSGTDNPTTLVHEQVEYLQELGRIGV